MTPFQLAILNLTRRKLPSAIAILSIAFSVAVSGILLRTNKLAADRFATIARGGEAIVGAKANTTEILLGALNGEGDYPGFLPYALFESMRSEQILDRSYLRSVIPFLYFAKYSGYRILGTDESFLRRPKSEDSLHLTQGVWAWGPQQVVLGSEVAEKLGLEIGAKISAQPWPASSNKFLDLTVVGVLAETHSTWDRLVYSNVQTAQAALTEDGLKGQSTWGSKVLNYFLIYLEPSGYESLYKTINNKTVGQAILVQKEIERLQVLAGTSHQLSLVVAALILFMGGLSISSLLITRYDAMALQIAVIRAIGYTKKAVALWLFWEGFLMGLVACLLGMALDLLFFPVIVKLLANSLAIPDGLNSSIFVSSPVWAAALAGTLISVFVPLYRVYNQDIHSSLRS